MTAQSISTKVLALCTSLIAGSAVAIAANPAQAFKFTTNYSAALGGSDIWKGNLILDSVTLDTNEVVNQFALVQSAKIVSNDVYTGGNTGAASADKGDKATIGLKQEAITEAGAVAALGNLNLNSIVDTEDSGSFAMDLFFDKALDNLFVWERGQNSKLKVQALDAAGNLIGNALTIYSKVGNNAGTDLAGDWQDAGFSLNTMEISRAQKVGSLGISLADFGVDAPISAVRFSSEKSFNGPDWKFVGSAAAVPEPGTIAGLAAVSALVAAARRRKVK